MAVYFSSTNYISLGNPTALDFNTKSDLTIMCWAHVVDYGTLIGKRYTVNNQQYQFGLNMSGTPFCKVGNTSPVNGTVDLSGAWYHYCLINYQNGASWYHYCLIDAGLTDTTAIGNTGTIAGDAHVLLGARRGSDNTDYAFGLKGTMEDVRFYNRALSVDEIETIYVCRGSDKINYGLVGRYFLNEGYPSQIVTGTGVVKDESNEKNNGTATGSPTYDNTGLKRF